MARVGGDRSRRFDILEHGKAVGRFGHDREVKAALRAWLREPSLLLVQIVGLILRMAATRADSDEPRAFELKIHDYVFHDRPGTHGPLFGMLVVGIHVPVVQRLVVASGSAGFW